MAYFASGLQTKSGTPYRFDVGGNPITEMGAPVDAADLPSDYAAQLTNIKATSTIDNSATSGRGTALPGMPSTTWLPGGSPTVPPTALPTAPAAISPKTFAAPTAAHGQTPYSANIGSGIPWAPGASQPSSSPPGYGWDPNLANFTESADPATRAVLAAFQAKGLAPYNEQDLQYWVNHINATGGWDNPANQQFWAQRMAAPQGGVGDYLERPEVGASTSTSTSTPTSPIYTTPPDSYGPTTTASPGTNPGLGPGGIDIAGLIKSLLQPPTPSTPALPGGFGSTGTSLLPDLNQVGQDPLSQLLNSAIGGVVQTGGTPYTQSVAQTLADLIAKGGQTAATDQTGQLVAARDAEATAEQGMLADLRNQLAARGTASEPGVPQGPEQFGIGRIAEQIAPDFANAIATIQQHGLDLANSNVMTALQEATGLSQSMATNVLQAVSLGTNRQQALATIALQTLDENRQWQEFLANYGLTRDQVAATIQQGNMQIVVQLINSFLTSAQVSAAGFV